MAPWAFFVFAPTVPSELTSGNVSSKTKVVNLTRKSERFGQKGAGPMKKLFSTTLIVLYLALNGSAFASTDTNLSCEQMLAYRPEVAVSLHAQAIMGKNFFGVEEAKKYFNIVPTEEQLLTLSKIPFSDATLGKCRETHLLISVFPLSLLDVREKNKELFYRFRWFVTEDFAKERGDASWQLVRKTPVPSSLNVPMSDQLILMNDNEDVPSARIMVYAIIGYFLSTSERLFEQTNVRCSDIDLTDFRVYVGLFDSKGLNIYHNWDGYCRPHIGIASAQNPEF